MGWRLLKYNLWDIFLIIILLIFPKIDYSVVFQVTHSFNASGKSGSIGPLSSDIR